MKYFSVPVDNNKPSVPVNSYIPSKNYLNKFNKLNICDIIYYSLVEPVESKIYIPPSERTVGMEPHKYTGSSIPSRSFRMLQSMTGQNNGKIFNLITYIILKTNTNEIRRSNM